MSPALEAAFRLKQILPVRTHLRSETAYEEEKRAYRWKFLGRGGHNRMSVVVKGKKYKSMRDAREDQRVAYKTMQKWVDLGIAKIG